MVCQSTSLLENGAQIQTKILGSRLDEGERSKNHREVSRVANYRQCKSNLGIQLMKKSYTRVNVSPRAAHQKAILEDELNYRLCAGDRNKDSRIQSRDPRGDD